MFHMGVDSKLLTYVWTHFVKTKINCTTLQCKRAGWSPLDWSAPLVARARAAATPLFSSVGPFDYTHKILLVPRRRCRRAATRKIRGSGLSSVLLFCSFLRFRTIPNEAVFTPSLGIIDHFGENLVFPN